MKLLENKRDELADEYIKEQAFDEDCLTERTNPGTPVGEHIYQTFCGCFVHDTFKAGFDSCLNELEPVLKELVDAITAAAEYDDTYDVNGEAGYIAWNALQKYKQLTGVK